MAKPGTISLSDWDGDDGDGAWEATKLTANKTIAIVNFISKL